MTSAIMGILDLVYVDDDDNDDDVDEEEDDDDDDDDNDCGSGSCGDEANVDLSNINNKWRERARKRELGQESE